MSNVSYIFHVLADLAKFAGKNEMHELEKAVFEAERTAQDEIRQRDIEASYQAVMDAVFPETRELRASQNSKC